MAALQLQMSAKVQAKSSGLSGRYAIYGEVASGGMASVLYGRLVGPVGFAKPVAIKRLHPHIAREPAVVSMFIDEARICARVSHANVVPILDVIEAPGELALVMEYVHGCTLEALLDLMREQGQQLPLRIAGALILGVLHGLEAAHEARNEQGEPLHIVHRDISPQNIMLGVDGIPRLFDFGIAQARGRLRSTPSGEVKGKLAYMAPEQLSAGPMDARVDLYGAAVVLWEVLTGRMLFDGAHESTVVHSVLYGEVSGPKTLRSELSDALDALVLRGLARDPAQRFQSAREMARALERTLVPASQSEVSEWLDTVAGARLRARAEVLREMQRAAEHGDQTQQETQRLPGERVDEDPGFLDLRAASERSRHRRSFLQRKSPRSWLLVALLAAALLMIGGLFVATREPAQETALGSEPTSDKAAPPPAASTSEPSTKAAEAREQADDWKSEPAPVVETEAPESEARTAPPEQVAPERARPRHESAPEKPRREPKPVPAKSSAHDCREPYVIDAQGVKRWKRECL